MDWNLLYPHSQVNGWYTPAPERESSEVVYEIDLMQIVAEKKERNLKINFGRFHVVLTRFIKNLFNEILATKHICFFEFYQCDYGPHFQLFVDFISKHKKIAQLKIILKEGLLSANRSFTDILPTTKMSLKFFALARAIAENSSLRILDLQEHGLSVENVPDIALILSRTPKLLTLNLSNNLFRDAGLIALAQLLAKNKSVAFFNVAGNKVSAEGGSRCLEILDSNYILCSYYLFLETQEFFDGKTCQTYTPYGFIARNRNLRWMNIHVILTDIYLSLAPLNLPAYVLLWILDYLEPMALKVDHHHLKKINHLQSLVNSRRSVIENRKSTSIAIV
jgi:hypothetical protein